MNTCEANIKYLLFARHFRRWDRSVMCSVWYFEIHKRICCTRFEFEKWMQKKNVHNSPCRKHRHINLASIILEIGIIFLFIIDLRCECFALSEERIWDLHTRRTCETLIAASHWHSDSIIIIIWAVYGLGFPRDREILTYETWSVLAAPCIST